jgi:hypothetical protein
VIACNALRSIIDGHGPDHITVTVPLTLNAEGSELGLTVSVDDGVRG